MAADLGLTATALYYHFVSKLHCLYTIFGQTLSADLEQLDRITEEEPRFENAFIALLDGAFDLTDEQMLRYRILVAEQGLVGVPRGSTEEEKTRMRARSLMRDIELRWTLLLKRGMEQGAVPAADPRMLARAVLGLYTSIWQWYRPSDRLSLADIRDFYEERCRLLIGIPAMNAGAAACKRDSRAA